MRQSPSLSWVIIIIIIIKLALEQHRFELVGGGPLYADVFSTVDISVLDSLQLVESKDVEPWIWRNPGYRGTVDRRTGYKLYEDFQLQEGSVPVTPLFVQGSITCLLFSF